ncbi:HMA2 domain-containing protein [Neobacillus sp. NPDC093127]|uniref:HMA2 domain-containing protein n=1 Tax=Neobacillus sp. NPDC093127 TaxID=3364296 RepID=UPI00382089C6
MEINYRIAHSIPGRLRVIIPALKNNTAYITIERMFSSLKGINKVRIEPIIQSMVIEYEPDVVGRNMILRYISLFFRQSRFDSLDRFTFQAGPDLRRDVFRSLCTGFLILTAYLRKGFSPRPDILVYAAVISTAYMVLTHGENKFRHPDVITGIASMFSLGISNILQVAMITWAVNALEIFHDMRRSQKLLYI